MDFKIDIRAKIEKEPLSVGAEDIGKLADAQSCNISDIEEVKTSLTTYFEGPNHEEYLSYLNALPLDILPKYLLEREQMRLKELLNLNLTSKYKFNYQRYLKNPFITISLLGMSILNFNRSHNKVLLAIINGYCVVDFSLRALLALTSYFSEKKEFNDHIISENAEIENLSQKINQSLEQRLSKTLVPEAKENVEKDLSTRIANIRSKITKLPEIEEAPYLSRLEAALKEYYNAQSLEKDCPIKLELDNKSSYLYTLNKELASIEHDLTEEHDLFVTNEEFNNILATSVTSYLKNLSAISDKTAYFMHLQNILIGLESDNVMRNIAVSNAYAECFWETIKLSEDREVETIKALTPELFIDALIARGEYELDSLNQTLEVISARTALLRLKENIDSTSYSKKAHLYSMISYLRTLNKSQNEALALGLTL